ncbi:MAG TPA: hypothetical protein VF771_02195, partial [Longimicrobiaceae bacterium]
RTGPDGNLLLQLIMQLTQYRELSEEEAGAAGVRFYGGSTVVADLTAPKISFCIRKPVDSPARLNRQLAFMQGLSTLGLRPTYFGAPVPGHVHEPFALLHRGV